MRVALYQPDIAQNVGSVIRLCACLGAQTDVIGPCGFPFDDRKIRRSAMDYLDHAGLRLYDGWEDWRAQNTGRILLLTTRAAQAYDTFRFAPGDALLLGRESAGVPEAVHEAADARLLIPMRPGLRSLNLAMSAAIVLGEAVRQIREENPWT